MQWLKRFDVKMHYHESELRSNPSDKEAILKDVDDVVKVTIDRIKKCRMWTRSPSIAHRKWISLNACCFCNQHEYEE